MFRCSWAFPPILAMVAFLCGLSLSVCSVARSQTSNEKSVEAADAAPTRDSEPLSEATDAEPKDPAPLLNARQALRTFIGAMDKKDYHTAISVLDFSTVDPAPDSLTKFSYAERLKACIDRLPLVDLSQISDAPDGAPIPFPPDNADAAIVISRGEDGRWRFAAKTVAEIDAIYSIVKDAPVTGTEATTAQPSTNKDATEASSAESSAQDEEADAPAAATPAVPEELGSARRTMRTLFEALENEESALAVATLDFSEMVAKDPEMGPYAKLELARLLKEVIERMALIDYAKISDDPEGPTFYFPHDDPNRPIEFARDESHVWHFSAKTVGRIRALHAEYGGKPVLNVAEEEKPWYARQLVLGNETWRILALFTAIFVSLFIGQSVRTVLKWRAEALDRGGHVLRSVISKTLARAAVGTFFLIGLSSGVKWLVLEHDLANLVSTVIHVIFALVIGLICFRLVDVAVEMLREFAKRTGSTLNNMLVPIVSTSLRLTIIILVGLEIATALSDQPPSTVLAGLGAGGLAIGLAAQDAIKNLFGSVMIFADRPFELGDRIVFDGHDGPVECVGFRSTRIRTLDGHLVTIPNGEMANKTIHNIGKRPFIRRIMNIRVTYDTPPEKVRRALDILRDVLADHEGMKEEFPPRVFLHDFLETAVNIRAIYWYHPPAYWDYCDFSERLNMQVVERFRAEGIRFALPSQRLFLAGDSEEPQDHDPKIV